MNNRTRKNYSVNRVESLMTTMWYLSAVILVLMVSINPAIATDSKSVATVVQTTGSSTSTNANGEKQIVVLRQALFAGDSLETGANGWMTFNFYDLTRVILRPDTKFHIREFPETTPSGKIVLEISQGGARITTGTIAADDTERFNLLTPYGELSGSRSEWVVRICAEDECEQLEKTFSQCSGYQSPDKQDRQFVSAYRGLLDLGYCSTHQGLNAGETSVFDPHANSCLILEEVPCFILLDEMLGRDKVRKFVPKLRPIIGDEQGSRRPARRPDPRAGQLRPRGDRPRRPPRRR